MPGPDQPAEGTRAAPFREGWILLGVWVASAALGWLYLRRGWIPHDVGTLGHAAERVLGGELPHRDFVDVYTGGQALLNALAFRLFGVELMTLRYVFFAAYLIWVPVFWTVARAFAGPALAAATTLLAASLTLPVYPEGMPSWFNLFLATGGAACLLRWHEVRRGGWLVAAGVCGGVSILFKIVGLFYVAAGLLFLLYVEAVGDGERSAAAAAAGAGDAPGPSGDGGYRALALAVCGVIALLVVYVVRTGSDVAGLAHFALPPLAAVTVVAARVARPGGQRSGGRVGTRTRIATVVRWWTPFVIGAVAPVALFVVPYALSGSVGALFEGVFVLPRLRFEFASWPSPPFLGFVPAVALVAWVAWSPSGATPVARVVTALGGALVVGTVAFTHNDIVYRVVWWTLRSLGPAVALAGALWLGRREPRPAAVLALALFGFCNLVQIPFAAPIYFLYAAPLLVLLAPALTTGVDASRRLLLVTVTLLGFSVLRIDAGFIYHLGFRYRPHEQTQALELERARGVRVSPIEKLEIEGLVQILDQIGTEAVLAMPDVPEVYFLTGIDNPTPTLFEFFEDADARAQRVLSLLDETGIGTVVVNRRQLFSPTVVGPLVDSLTARYPYRGEAGRFVVITNEIGGG